MFFEYPKLLWLLTVPALLVLHYLYLELAERHPHLRVSTSVPWMARKTTVAGAVRHIPFVIEDSCLVPDRDSHRKTEVF